MGRAGFSKLECVPEDTMEMLYKEEAIISILPHQTILYFIEYISSTTNRTVYRNKKMKAFSIVALAGLLPSLVQAHYLWPQLILNGKVTAPFEYVREHDNGFMPSWSDGAFLNSNDLRCNKGSMNHRTQPKTARVVAGQDVVGFATNVQSEIRHPGPLQVSASILTTYTPLDKLHVLREQE